MKRDAKHGDGYIIKDKRQNQEKYFSSSYSHDLRAVLVKY